jgi:formylglycine-generating enzyme required for sulfatase activity
VQNSSSEAVLDEFIRGFPDSVYVRFAKARIEELKRNRTSSGGDNGSSWWPWASGQSQPPQAQAEKPSGTQTAVIAPSKPVQPPSAPACDGLTVAVAMGPAPCIKPGSGESFKDCAECPEMVLVPAGSFMMGSPDSYSLRSSDEGPQHEVRIEKPFAVGRFAVTFSEWDACVAAGGCGGYKPKDQGWGRDDRPAINVSWNDAKAYVVWLSNKTGKTYRLLTEAEREYVARAGTKTLFWWGASISASEANYDGTPFEGSQKGENRQKTLPVKSFQPNPWGLYQVHGNVWEWEEDCLNLGYNGAPNDGSAWTTTGICEKRAIRGGSWGTSAWFLRAASRASYGSEIRVDVIGFRVARTTP